MKNQTQFRFSRRRAQLRPVRRRGATVVEFALIVPILLALLMGIIEFAWMARAQLTVANAAREGIRFAALGNTSTNVRTRIINTATVLNPDVTTAQITLEQTSDRTTSNPTYYAWPADVGTKNGVAAGNLIRIRVAYPNRSLTGFFPFMNNRTITVEVSMAREAS